MNLEKRARSALANIKEFESGYKMTFDNPEHTRPLTRLELELSELVKEFLSKPAEYEYRVAEENIGRLDTWGPKFSPDISFATQAEAEAAILEPHEFVVRRSYQRNWERV